MARATQTKPVAGLVAPVDDTTSVVPASDDVEAFLNDVGADGALLVKIERRQEEGPSVGKWGFCAKRQATGAVLEDIQRDFGPGTYQLTMTDADTGQYRRRAVILVHPSAGGAAGSAAVPVPAATDPRLDRMERLFDRLMESLIARPQAAATSPLDDLSKVVGVVAKLIPQSSGNDERRALDMYLRGREEGEKSGREVATLAAGGGDETQAIAQIGGSLIDLMRQHTEATRANGATGGPSVGVPPRASTVQPALDVSPLWVQMLRPYKNDLLLRARMGKNARVYANMVVEDVPDTMLGRVAEIVADRDFGSQFLAAFPEFNATVELQQWVADFIDEIRELLKPDEGEGEDAPQSGVVNG